MAFKDRKRILNAAKEEISRNLKEELDNLHEKKDDLIKLFGDDWYESEEISKISDQIHQLSSRSNEWHSSSRSKKKKAVQWTDDRARKETQSTARRRKAIDWDAAREVKKDQDSLKKNNGEWLYEGCLVVHKDSKDRLMIVVENNLETGTAKVLDGGHLKNVRSLQLRPAIDD